MLALILAAAATAPVSGNRLADALQLCRPQLAKRISGDISAVRAEAASSNGRTTSVRGSITALIGMGEPEPGFASTHHLIRAEYRFICRITDSRVKKISINRIR